MTWNRMKTMTAGLIAAGALTVAAPASAQDSRYGDEGSVVVECAPGQRAVMQQRRIDGRTQLVARCERAATSVARRSSVRHVERAPRRTKTKTALMIAGSTATGAGVGGALNGRKGALVGAAIGGGSATVYEAIRRR